MDILAFDNRAMERIPSTDSNNEYWLVRAEGGLYFNDFFSNNFIAIGWNEISTEEIENNSYNSDLIRSKLMVSKHLVNNTKNKRRMGSAAKQMIRFQEDINIGNIIMVPSENSDSFAVGEVVSEVYTETDEEKIDVSHCPFIKRRKVSWYGSFPRNNFDPALRSIIFAAHTISNVTLYKGYINRVVFDTYTENNIMHMTFNTKQTESIDLDTLTELLVSYRAITKILYPNEKIAIKINLQSPGPIEIIGLITAVGSVAALIWRLSPYASKISASLNNVVKNGGKLSIGKGAFSIELPNQTEMENKQKNRERELTMAEEIHDLVKREKQLEITKLYSEIYGVEDITHEKASNLLDASNKFIEISKILDTKFPESFSDAMEAEKEELDRAAKDGDEKKAPFSEGE